MGALTNTSSLVSERFLNIYYERKKLWFVSILVKVTGNFLSHTLRYL